jgi:hypothetical protein
MAGNDPKQSYTVCLWKGVVNFHTSLARPATAGIGSTKPLGLSSEGLRISYICRDGEAIPEIGPWFWSRE